MRRKSGIAALAAVVMTGALVLAPVPAQADPGGTCTTVSTTRTCEFAFTGAEQTFTVPAGVTSVDVVAIGAAGGIGLDGAPGGSGARVEGTLTVSGGQVLYVEVGGAPTTDGSCYPTVSCIGGWNGGGSSTFGGGGGGASDVRTIPSASGGTLASRLLVAGAGGGGGEGFFAPGGCLVVGTIPGGAGGDAGQPGLPGDSSCGTPVGQGGGAGTAIAGGAGGSDFGVAGVLAQGGGGGLDTGGGGGGGLWGGGGGGNLGFSGFDLLPAGGGGGGSSLVPVGGTETVTTDLAGVTISFVVAQPAIAVTASTYVPLGDPVTATASFAGGAAPGGLITFALYGPDDATCAGNPVATSSAAVSGNGTYSSAAATPTAPGTYRWVATYPGDDGNLAAASACATAAAAVVVAAVMLAASGSDVPGSSVALGIALFLAGILALLVVRRRRAVTRPGGKPDLQE